ncbi:G-protein coupled receptor 183-like [Arapaima gigas]
MTVKLYTITRYQLAREPPSPDRESKKESLRLLVFVVVCFLGLWCPSFVNIVVKQLTASGLKFRNEATNLFATMARFNALSTPALYIWGSPALREAGPFRGRQRRREQFKITGRKKVHEVPRESAGVAGM